MSRLMTSVLATTLIAIPACNLEIPLNPSDLARPFANFAEDLQDSVDRAAADPFGARPFPRLIGGNNRDVFYATNLADVRIDFAGPTNNIILPGITGASNLYVYDLDQRERNLAETFLPSALVTPFANMVTDGTYVAYTIADEDGLRVDAGRIGQSVQTVFRTVKDGERFASLELVMDEGRLAFQVFDFADDGFFIRVIDLLDRTLPQEFVTEGLARIALNGDRLAWLSSTQGPTGNVTLIELSTGNITVLADRLAVETPLDNDLAIADNLVVWSETTGDGLKRISAYDMPTKTGFVWADGVAGRLAGATDDFFVTEEVELRLPRAPDRISVRRYDADGRMRTLARFPREGLAGQATVAGQNVVWVNPERRVIVAPIAGGDRQSFRPF